MKDRPIEIDASDAKSLLENSKLSGKSISVNYDKNIPSQEYLVVGEPNKGLAMLIARDSLSTDYIHIFFASENTDKSLNISWEETVPKGHSKYVIYEKKFLEGKFQ